MQKKVKRKTSDEIQNVSDDVNEAVDEILALLQKDKDVFETPAQRLHLV